MKKRRFKYTKVYLGGMAVTTIKLQHTTKQALNQLREYPGESYDRLVQKALRIAELAQSKPRLSQATMREIAASRRRFAKGEFYTEEEAKQLLGVDDVSGSV